MKSMILFVCVLTLLVLLVIPVLDKVLAELPSDEAPETLEQRTPGCACGRGVYVACVPADYALVRTA